MSEEKSSEYLAKARKCIQWHLSEHPIQELWLRSADCAFWGFGTEQKRIILVDGFYTDKNEIQCDVSVRHVGTEENDTVLAEMIEKKEQDGYKCFAISFPIDKEE